MSRSDCRLSRADRHSACRCCEPCGTSHPGILLHINQSFGEVYSELIMTGRLEVAIIHGAGPLKGVRFVPLMVERFFLVVAESMCPPAVDGTTSVQGLVGLPLLLPPRYNFVRKAVELAFTRARSTPRIAAEIEFDRRAARRRRCWAWCNDPALVGGQSSRRARQFGHPAHRQPDDRRHSLAVYLGLSAAVRPGRGHP